MTGEQFWAVDGKSLNVVSPAETPTMNVVLFLIDDLGWKDLGCQGSDYYQTPNIDRLAAEGTRFTDAYAACALCSPTRASVMTGQYPARNTVSGNPRFGIADAEMLISRVTNTDASPRTRAFALRLLDPNHKQEQDS